MPRVSITRALCAATIALAATACADGAVLAGAPQSPQTPTSVADATTAGPLPAGIRARAVSYVMADGREVVLRRDTRTNGGMRVMQPSIMLGGGSDIRAVRVAVTAAEAPPPALTIDMRLSDACAGALRQSGGAPVALGQVLTVVFPPQESGAAYTADLPVPPACRGLWRGRLLADLPHLSVPD